MFDLTGSYRIVWIFCVLLSVIAGCPSACQSTSVT
jgi:hypothetical protein